MIGGYPHPRFKKHPRNWLVRNGTPNFELLFLGQKKSLKSLPILGHLLFRNWLQNISDVDMTLDTKNKRIRYEPHLTIHMSSPAVEYFPKRAMFFPSRRLSSGQELGDLHGTRPLHLAALRGHLEVVRTLVEAGAPSRVPEGQKSKTAWNWFILAGLYFPAAILSILFGLFGLFGFAKSCHSMFSCLVIINLNVY